jgi:dipeptidyl aminopeptidase/acylaminoacyl peptidase
MSENGNDRRFLENAPKQSECPRWSPDGTRLAFSSMVSGKSQLFVIKVDGSNLTQLTASPQSSYVHAWEPNGERIAYVDETSSDIYLVSSNGGTPVRVTSDGQFKGWTPAWSSDGKWIVYSSHGIDANHPPGFYAIHPDGSGRRLLFEFGGAMDAAISRTGDLLAFWAITGSEGSQASGIFVKNLRGLLQ